jgi:hypothetical protein
MIPVICRDFVNLFVPPFSLWSKSMHSKLFYVFVYCY